MYILLAEKPKGKIPVSKLGKPIPSVYIASVPDDVKRVVDANTEKDIPFIPVTTHEGHKVVNVITVDAKPNDIVKSATGIQNVSDDDLCGKWDDQTTRRWQINGERRMVIYANDEKAIKEWRERTGNPTPKIPNVIITGVSLSDIIRVLGAVDGK